MPVTTSKGQKQEEAKEISSSESSERERELYPKNTLISDSEPLELGENAFSLF